jgi:iron complex outermembrane receptor protein
VTRAPGPITETRAQLLAGSRDTQRIDLAQDWASGAHRAQLSVGLQADDGFPNRHDSYQAGRLNARWQSQLSPRDRLDLQFGIRNADVGTGFAGDPFQPPRTNDLSYHYQQLNWQRFLDDGSDLTLQLYHTHQDSNDRYDLVPGLYFVDRGFVAKRGDAELQWRGAIGGTTRLVLGAGMRLDQAESPYGIAADANNERLQYRLFGHGEQRLSEQWLLQGGLMVEHFEGVGTYVSPRVSLNYQYRPQHALRLSAARGYRLPSLFEQEAAFGAFPYALAPELIFYRTPDALDPERIIAYELGLVGELGTPLLTYDLKVFRHDMDDLVFAAENLDAPVDPGNPTLGNQWQFQNNGELELLGLELGVAARISQRTRLRLAYSLADADESKIRAFDAFGITRIDPLRPTVPRHTLGALLSHHFSAGWAASLSWSYVDDMQWTGEGDPVDAIHRVDAKLGKELQIHGSSVRLELIAQNLLNDAFYDFNVREPSGDRPGNLFERRIYGQIVVRH